MTTLVPNEEPMLCFVGQTHREVLAREIPERNELVEDIIDAGTVGVIAGLPFVGKSWLGLELAHKVAAGEGLVLGRFPVLVGGPVIFCWQDDSERNELLRIHTYAERHDEYPRDLPIRWLLNEGVRLPHDIEPLRDLVAQDGAAVLIFDSVYNHLSPDVELKAEAVATVFAAVKHDICDPTGCTVAFIDHAPWPTDSNKGQRRSYGSVFKAAAVRWGLHLEADKDDTRLHVEARGNNIAGVRRSPALFDPDTLEIRLLDVDRISEEEVDGRVFDFLAEAGWTVTSGVCEAVTGRDKSIRSSLQRQKQAGRVTSASARDIGRAGTGTYWNVSNHASPEVGPLFGPTPADLATGYVTNEVGRPGEPHPVGAADLPRADLEPVNEDELERLAELAIGAQHTPRPETQPDHGYD